MKKKQIQKINDITLYKKHISKKLIIILILLVFVLLLSIISINVGSSWINPLEVIKAFFKIGDEKNILIVWNIRLPRVTAAIIAGAGLALSGCVMQNVLKNPMASPSTLGVSSGAVFGANFAIIILGAGMFHSTDGTSITINNPYLVSIIAFLFAMASTFIILSLSKYQKYSSEVIVLAGVAIGAIFTAGTTLIQYFSIDSQVAAAVYWSFGNLSRATKNENIIMFIIISLAFIYFYLRRWDFNAMAHGEDVAKSLGVRTESTRFISLLLSSLITAVCVSFLGIIGFVGLIAPHIMKRFLGSDNRFLLPASCLAGSALLLFSDTIGRILIKGISLPVGAVTALLGGPMFLYLIFYKKGRNL